MVVLGKLIKMQVVFAGLSLTFLVASAARQSLVGEPLSAAPVVPAIIMFLIYLACLTLPRFGRVGLYRVGMALAVLAFGGGGVIGNLFNYMSSGLEDYASFSIWVLAVAINAYGTVLNLIALFGLYRLQDERPEATAP